MQYDQGSLLTTVLAVQSFLQRHAERLGPIATCGASRKIHEIAAALDADGRTQEDRALAAKAATVRRIEARRALISDHMQPIALVAEAEVHQYAELTALHMPRLNVSDQQLIQQARAMATAAAEYTTVFADGLRGDTFVADLERATDQLVEALQERVECVATRQRATAGLEATSQAGRKRLRILDRLVRAVIRSDPALLVEWNSTKRIATKPGPARGSEAPAAPQLTAVASMPAAERQAA